MNITTLAVRNVSRNGFRTSLTILGVAVAIVAFVLLRTVIDAWEVGIQQAATDRIGTRHKVSIIMTLPRRYIDRIRTVPGIRAATFATWFGARDPRDEGNFFASMAVDTDSYLDVFDEMRVSPETRARWKADRQGAILGDVLAKKWNLHPGDRVTIAGTIYPGDWTFNVDGIYEATRQSVDRSQLIFHWNYLNESVSEARRDQIGWIVSRIDDPSQVPDITRRVDQVFDTQEIQTLSMSERALNASFLSMFSSILKAIDIVSIIILSILSMILGNTIAMGVRERTNEFGVLRALGYLPRHVAMFILFESVVMGLAAGVIGLLLSYPIIQLGLGRFIEENMGGFFPYFRIEPRTAALAFVLSTVLALAAAAVPAWRASRLTVIDALRRLN